jgi:hypothetical protein
MVAPALIPVVFLGGESVMTIIRELYDAFRRVEIDRWDAIIAEDVLANSPGGLGIKGRAPLKAWAGDAQQ